MSSLEVALKQISMRPLDWITLAVCRSSASESSTSTIATRAGACVLSLREIRQFDLMAVTGALIEAAQEAARTCAGIAQDIQTVCAVMLEMARREHWATIEDNALPRVLVEVLREVKDAVELAFDGVAAEQLVVAAEGFAEHDEVLLPLRRETIANGFGEDLPELVLDVLDRVDPEADASCSGKVPMCLSIRVTNPKLRSAIIGCRSEHQLDVFAELVLFLKQQLLHAQALLRRDV